MWQNVIEVLKGIVIAILVLLKLIYNQDTMLLKIYLSNYKKTRLYME